LTKEKRHRIGLRTVKAKAKKKLVARAEQVEQETPSVDRTSLPTIPSGSSTDTHFQTQADYLSDPAIGTASRQAAAADLGRLAGNRYLQRLVVQMDDDRKAKGRKKPKKVQKKLIGKAKSVAILQEAYGDIKKISGGTVVWLGQAEFEAAYEQIYGKTKWAWDKYVVPMFGNLEGFAYKRTNYINKDIATVDVVPHEMLHNNATQGWIEYAGSNITEGATEYLTIKAVKAAGYKPTHSYPNQEKVIRKLVKVVGEDTLMNAYFKNILVIIKAVDDKCTGSWDNFKKAMDESKWFKAKLLLNKKK